jgi:hypothetical protein
MIQQEYQGHEVLAKSRIGKCKAGMENRQKKKSKGWQTSAFQRMANIYFYYSI